MTVQATLYKMCEKILADNVLVSEVTYRLPNKVRLPPLPSLQIIDDELHPALLCGRYDLL